MPIVKLQIKVNRKDKIRARELKLALGQNTASASDTSLASGKEKHAYKESVHHTYVMEILSVSIVNPDGDSGHSHSQ